MVRRGELEDQERGRDSRSKSEDKARFVFNWGKGDSVLSQCLVVISFLLIFKSA